MHRRALLLATALAGTLLTLPALASGEVQVVTSITILADMIRHVGGEHVTVTELVGPNGDAHAFEPGPGDAKAVGEADLVVVNGLDFESFMGRLMAASGFNGPVVTASQGVTPRKMEEESRTVTDPHAWQDLTNGKLYVQNIERALAAADPAHAADYAANASAYLDEIASLDGWVRSEIAKVPQPQRKVVTSHDAFSYFGNAYGVQFVAAEGMSEDAEPSAAGLKQLVDQVRHERIKVLFFENALSPRFVEQIARETGAKVGGTLYTDALSEPGGSADSYLGMFRYNVPLLRDAMLASGGQG
jgi:zinc/manganese transport system substrate-binding protein